MSSFRLADVALPDFGLPDVQPEVPRAIYDLRFQAFTRRLAETGLHGAVVYADREHSANLAYLTGFDPRFEEALLVVIPGRTPVFITGPENQGPAAAAEIDAEVRLSPTFGLLGQDRSRTPPLADLLAGCGLGTGQRIGMLGWKYFGAAEAQDPDSWIEVPSFITETVRSLVGPGGRVVNANRLLMDSTSGLRAVNEIDQLAFFEFASAHASEAVKRVIFGVEPGLREYEAAALMRLNGQPHSCHTMLSSGHRAVGLSSPSGKVIARGERFTVALGYWGNLTSRTGWIAEDAGDLPEPARDYVERLAAPFFACVAEWYETIGIGVSGGDLHAVVMRHLGTPFFNLVLNPGHLIHLDEWLNTPVYAGSTERFRSHQAVQCDIIAAAAAPYFGINIEDGVALLDEDGRRAFAGRHPDAWDRVEARRAFMRDVIGIRLKPEVLPFSNLAAYFNPYMLAPGRAMVRC